MISYTPLFSSLYNSSTYSAHLSITSSFSIKTFPCLLLIVCNPLFPFGRSSLFLFRPQQRSKITDASLSFHGTALVPVSSARNLGVVFESDLSFDQHIFNVCRSS